VAAGRAGNGVEDVHVMETGHAVGAALAEPDYSGRGAVPRGRIKDGEAR
jgi:hypothetical protein